MSDLTILRGKMWTRISKEFLPFADAKALAVHDAFERGAYQLVNAER